MVAPSLEAADRLAKEGVEVEVIDLRTLMPFDKAAIFASLEKTSRVLIVHEDVKTLGIGAELSAVIMEERFDVLDAPVMRRDLSRHPRAVLARARGGQPAERRQDRRRAAHARRLLTVSENRVDQTDFDEELIGPYRAPVDAGGGRDGHVRPRQHVADVDVQPE